MPKPLAKQPLVPREIDLPPRDYQPSKAELEEEIDMPEADMDTIRAAFGRPFIIRSQD